MDSIAYRHDQDRGNLQHFIGCAEWESQPLMMELARQVGEELGEEDGVIGDDEMGRNATFRRDLNERGEPYLLAVPCDTLVRDLEAEPPRYHRRGAIPKVPFQRVDKWRDALVDDAWTKIKVRDAEKGPLEIEVARCRAQARISQRVMPQEETLVIIRCLDEEGATKYDYYLSNASRETPIKEFARVATAAHRVEEAIKRSKSQAGLSHYEDHTRHQPRHESVCLRQLPFVVESAWQANVCPCQVDSVAVRWQRKQ